MLTMYDAINIANIPHDAQYAAGYVGGSWPTYANGSLAKALPKARLLSIAISEAENAECLDVEPLDATPNQAAPWVKRQIARGIYRPVIYASASTMGTILADLAAAGIHRSQVRVWTAHYGRGAHICGPSSCKQLSVPADGTQWTSTANGLSLDESLLLDNFFAPKPTTPTPAPPASNWQEKMMISLPTLKVNTPETTHHNVKRAQALIQAVYIPALKVDGAFGPVTESAVKAVQKAAGIPVTGSIDPATWTVLVTGAR